ncbi:uncharacterized protein LOC144752409 [Lissotriton helveticus]
MAAAHVRDRKDLPAINLQRNAGGKHQTAPSSLSGHVPTAETSTGILQGAALRGKEKPSCLSSGDRVQTASRECFCAQDKAVQRPSEKYLLDGHHQEGADHGGLQVPQHSLLKEMQNDVDLQRQLQLQQNLNDLSLQRQLQHQVHKRLRGLLKTEQSF